MKTKLMLLMAALAGTDFLQLRPASARRRDRPNQSESQRVERLEAAQEKRQRREARNRKVHGHE